MSDFILLTLVIGVFDLVGTVSAKFWSENKNMWFLILTAFCFAVAGVIFAYTMKLNSMAIVNISWDVISVLLVTLFGYFYFKENLSLLQLFGFFTVLGGFIMINIQAK